jgi:hypothetical protein
MSKDSDDLKQFHQWMESASADALQVAFQLLKDKLVDQADSDHEDYLIENIIEHLELDRFNSVEQNEIKRLLPILCDVKLHEIDQRCDGSSAYGYKLTWRKLDLTIEHVSHSHHSASWDTGDVTTSADLKTLMSSFPLEVKHLNAEQFISLMSTVIKSISRVMPQLLNEWELDHLIDKWQEWSSLPAK